MQNFQKIILFSASVLLLITLLFIGAALSYPPRQEWPPITTSCPDYWTLAANDGKAVCVNRKNLGTCPPQNGNPHLTMDFSTPAFGGANGPCAKYTWAKRCGVSWDGITYGVANPCAYS